MSLRFDRRHFLKGTAAAAGIAAFHAGCGRRKGAWRFFTDAEGQVLEALCEQIVPGDQDSGAREAGVLNFIDRQIVGPLQRFQEDYRRGLAALQRTSQALNGNFFPQLSWDEQRTLLGKLEAGDVPEALWPSISAPRFFSMVVDHTMQGFYGSPRHGGNRRFVSYRMLKLDYPPIVGQNRYKL